MPEAQPIDDISAALEGALGIEPAAEETPAPDEPLVHEDGTPLSEEEIALLADEETPPAEDGDFELPDTIDIKAFAELAGIDVDYLYNNMTMTSANGDPITIGAWKDQQKGGSNIQQQQQQVIAAQQNIEAQTALREQYGDPIRRYQSALKEISEKYQDTNWKELTDEHGDKAELARIQMQQRYSQIQSELGKMEGEYQQALGGHATQVAQQQLAEIVKTHPTWTDMNIAMEAMHGIHDAISGTGITYEQMINEVGGMGGVAKLAILELAAKGAAAGNIDPHKVRKVAKSLRSGRTISATQQKRMQRAKAIKAARGGSRREQQQAAVDLIAANGGL